MKIGLIPMAAKPYHAGHDGLIEIAASENDVVHVYVSTGGREGISGQDMMDIWKNIIEKSLKKRFGAKVKVEYVPVPVKSVYQKLGESNSGTATIKKGEGNGVDILSKYINTMQDAVADNKWKLYDPRLIRLKKLSDGTVLSNAIANIDSELSKVSLSDDATFKDFIKAKIKDHAKESNIPDTVIDELIKRAFDEDDKLSLLDLKKKYPREFESIRALDNSMAAIIKEGIKPIETVIHKFAVEVLRGLESTLIAKSDEEVDRLKASVRSAIKEIESTGDDKKIETMQKHLQKLENIENIGSAMEGVVFIYKGKAYKFTGAFAPANQILGIFRYSR